MYPVYVIPENQYNGAEHSSFKDDHTAARSVGYNIGKKLMLLLPAWQVQIVREANKWTLLVYIPWNNSNRDLVYLIGE